MRPASNLFEKGSLGSPCVLFWFRGRPSVWREVCCHVLEVFFLDWQCCLNNGPPSLVPKWNLTTLILLYIRKLQEFYKDTISLTVDLFFSVCINYTNSALYLLHQKLHLFPNIEYFIALTLRVLWANKSCTGDISWDWLNTNPMEHRWDSPASKGACHQAWWPEENRLFWVFYDLSTHARMCAPQP